MILFIIFMLGFVGLTVLVVLNTISLLKNPIQTINYKKEFLKIGLFAGGAALSFTIAINFIYLWANIFPLIWELLCSIIFPLAFSAALLTFFVTFVIHYYKKNVPEEVNKILFRVYAISIPVLAISLFYSFNGFANYMTFPLVNGLSFTEGFVYKRHFSGGISFYAICILSGALLAYALSDHKMYQQYGKHGTLDSTFLVAFPAGIIGARIWYVVGNWEVDGFNTDFWAIFRIWDGGLTILGGAIMGILVGVLWFMWRNKKLNIWVAVDVILPTILVAQAIGRLGNFFNVEVHGNPVSTEYFYWMPLIFVKNGMYSSQLSPLAEGQMYLPLFFIEGVMNIGGFFFLSELFGRKYRKVTELGDIAFGYVVTYGLIRFVLEPFRDEHFYMGTNGFWSFVFAGLFVVAGMLGIFINHLVRFLLRQKKNEQKAPQNWAKTLQIVLVSLSIGAGALLGGGAVLMAMEKPDITKLSASLFNLGIILLVAGVAVLFAIGCVVLYKIEAKKLINEGSNA